MEYFDVEPTQTVIKEYTTKNGTVIKEEVKIPVEPPWITDFSKTIGVTRQRLHEWAKQFPEFRDAMTRAKELQEAIIAKNGLMRLYDGGFAFKSLVNTADWRGETRTIEGTLTLEDKLSHLLADDQPKQIEGEAIDAEAETG